MNRPISTFRLVVILALVAIAMGWALDLHPW